MRPTVFSDYTIHHPRPISSQRSIFINLYKCHALNVIGLLLDQKVVTLILRYRTYKKFEFQTFLR